MKVTLDEARKLTKDFLTIGADNGSRIPDDIAERLLALIDRVEEEIGKLEKIYTAKFTSGADYENPVAHNSRIRREFVLLTDRLRAPLEVKE